ncbi:hypothetical protein JCM6882_008244 [Rhodosporidiobolus microsporus]
MSATPAAKPLACVVCGSTDSPQRCSACKVETYCGEGCMKLHWILHKALCGRPTDTCYYPPLSKDEQTMLRRAQHFPFYDGPQDAKSPSLIAHSFVTTLSQPYSLCPIPEPRRSYLLAYARNHLSESISLDFSISTSKTGTFAFRSASVWRHLSLHIVGVFDDMFLLMGAQNRPREDWDLDALNIFEVWNEYLREVALVSALWTWSSPYPAPPALTDEKLDVALARKGAAIERVDTPEMMKERLRDMHEANREMNEKAKRWLLTPYHV